MDADTIIGVVIGAAIYFLFRDILIPHIIKRLKGDDKTMIIVDYIVANECQNREESYDMLCVKCGRCGRVLDECGIMVDAGGTTAKEDCDE